MADHTPSPTAVNARPRLLDLPHGHRTTIDEADWPLVAGLTLYRGTNGYVYFSTWSEGASRPQTLHSYLLGGSRTGLHIDHINGDPLDNRRSNLRFVTPSVNQANRKRRPGRRGVTYSPGLSASKPWRAQITANRKNLHLGLFATEAEAVEARRAAELHHFGEYCP
jgi:hypothetical protein